MSCLSSFQALALHLSAFLIGCTHAVLPCSQYSPLLHFSFFSCLPHTIAPPLPHFSPPMFLRRFYDELTKISSNSYSILPHLHFETPIVPTKTLICISALGAPFRWATIQTSSIPLSNCQTPNRWFLWSIPLDLPLSNVPIVLPLLSTKISFLHHDLFAC